MKKLFIQLLIFLIFLSLIIGGFYGYKSYKRYKSYKEDGIFLLNYLENNYPYFQVKEKALNYKFLEHKDEFIKKISKSKDNLDFYRNVTEVICSLQNAHSNIAYEPLYLSQFNNEDIIEKASYWKNVKISNAYFPDIRWNYIQGKYIVIKSRNKNIPVGSIITKFNGKEINDYIQSQKETFYLHKDFKRNLFYANDEYFKYDATPDDVEILFNKQKKNAVITYTKINEEIERWYFDTPQYGTKTEPNVTTNILNNNRLAYLRIKSFATNNFENDKNIIKEFLKKCSNIDNLVIDIRGNRGGQNTYGDFLISSLIDKKISLIYYDCFKNKEYVNESTFFDISLMNLQPSPAPATSYNLNDFKIFKRTTCINPLEDSIKFKGNIYILVDNSVYSASEHFIDIVKKSGIAKIIGTTTGGDGTGYEAIATYLPNSKLVIKIPPSLTINQDGTVNEEVHTEPDIYMEQDLEDYKKYLKSGLKDIVASEYDTVYKETMNMLQK